MDEALIGLAGIVVGVLLGAAGTYFRLRRDLWAEARANALVLLADVRALKSRPSDQVLADTLLVTKNWDSRGEALVRFRRGNYPSGLKACEWLKLAGHFAELRKLSARGVSPADTQCLGDVQKELKGAEVVLDGFASDPPVLPYVVATGVKEGWMACLGLAILALVIVLYVLGDLSWLVAFPVFALAIVIVVWWVRRTRRAPSERVEE